MAITVGDVLLKITADDSDVKSKLGALDTQLSSIGIGLMAAGAAIAAALGVAVKSAEEERITIVKLEQALKNVGVAYDEVGESLEQNMAATMKKTGMSDEKQRDALRKLIVVTGDYKEALDLLPLAIDMAAGMDMDLTSASQLLGRVMEGNVGVLRRYGIVLKEGATSAEAFAAIQAKIGGMAEAAASPMQILTESMGELSETVGGVLLPVFNDLLKNNLLPFIEGLQSFVKEHPQVIKALAVLAGALIAGGGLIAAMMMLSKAIVAVNTALIIMQSLTGIGILKVIAGLAVAGGAIYGMNKLMEGTSNSGATGTPETEAERVQRIYGTPMAAGGIVRQPTLALLGEAGAEAVVPLSRMGGVSGGTTLNIHVGNFMGDELSLRQFTRKISDILNQEERRSFNKPSQTTYYSEAGHL
jgi:hypothetical protein